MVPATLDLGIKSAIQLIREARTRKVYTETAFLLRRERRVQAFKEWYKECGMFYTTTDEEQEPWSNFFTDSEDEEPPAPRPGCRGDRQKIFEHYAAEHDAHNDYYDRCDMWMGEHFEKYEAAFKCTLANLLAPGKGGANLLSKQEELVDAALDKPDAFFLCTLCSHSPLPYPNIHDHWRKAHRDVSAFTNSGPCGYGGQIRLKAWHAGRTLVGKMLDAIGLPQSETGRKELDELARDRSLYCSCRHPDGLPDLRKRRSWTNLVRTPSQSPQRISDFLTSSCPSDSF